MLGAAVICADSDARKGRTFKKRSSVPEARCSPNVSSAVNWEANVTLEGARDTLLKSKSCSRMKVERR